MSTLDLINYVYSLDIAPISLRTTPNPCIIDGASNSCIPVGGTSLR